MHPQPEQELIFRIVFAGRVRFGCIFRRSLRATTKKILAMRMARYGPGYLTTLLVRTLLSCVRYLIAYLSYGAPVGDRHAWSAMRHLRTYAIDTD